MAEILSECLAPSGFSIKWDEGEWSSSPLAHGSFQIAVRGVQVPHTPPHEGIRMLGMLLTLDGRTRRSVTAGVDSAWRALWALKHL
eukprot:7715713-Lingulodinium_polyedra.AAC.1